MRKAMKGVSSIMVLAAGLYREMVISAFSLVPRRA